LQYVALQSATQLQRQKKRQTRRSAIIEEDIENQDEPSGARKGGISDDDVTLSL